MQISYVTSPIPEKKAISMRIQIEAPFADYKIAAEDH